MSIRVCAGDVVDLNAAHKYTESQWDSYVPEEGDDEEDPYTKPNMGNIWSVYMSWRDSMSKEDRIIELIRERTHTVVRVSLTAPPPEYPHEHTLFLPIRIVRVPASGVDTVQESDSDRLALKDALLKLNSHVDKQIAFKESHMQFRAVPCSKLIPRPFTIDIPLPDYF